MQNLRPEAAAGLPYVPGVVAEGRFVFVSGQTPTRKGQVVGETIETQTQVVFETIEWILDDAGATLLDVVRCGVFLADLGDLTGFNVVYRRAFGDRLPARTTVGAFLPGYRVEIDCIAAIPSNSERTDR